MIKTLLKLTLCLLLLGGCQERSSSPEKEEKADSKLTDIEEESKAIDFLLTTYHDAGKFNGNVLVFEKGRTLLHKSYGYSDAQKEKELELESKFGIGSIFKEFPAVSIMKLEEAGLINLEDKIDQYLPELPSWSKEISIKNLLQYTSGLPSVDWNKYFSKDLPIGDEEIRNDLLAIKELAFKPGTDYLYSNNSPFLLIKIIEKVTNKSFKNYIQEELLTPLKMNGTQIKKQYPYEDRHLMALPFDTDYKEDQYKVNSPTILFASTASDLNQWLVNLNSYKVISKASMSFLAKTAALKNEYMQAPLGNCILEEDSIEEHTHHGSMGNYECLVQRFNKEDLTIVLLTNQKNKNLSELSELIVGLLNKL